MDLANPLMFVVAVIQEPKMETNLKVDALEIGSSKSVFSQGPILLLRGCLPIGLEHVRFSSIRPSYPIR